MFTPQSGESYALRTEEGHRLPLPPVREQGVALQVPHSVMKPGEFPEAVVTVVGSPRHIVAAAFCRGTLVAHETVHGLAGSAAVALLVLATVSSAAWAIAYLLLFGTGTIVGMVMVTAVIALPASMAVARVRGARRWLTLASGVVSLAFGVFLARELTGSDGVFSDTPVWTPR